MAVENIAKEATLENTVTPINPVGSVEQAAQETLKIPAKKIKKKRSFIQRVKRALLVSTTAILGLSGAGIWAVNSSNVNSRYFRKQWLDVDKQPTTGDTAPRPENLIQEMRGYGRMDEFSKKAAKHAGMQCAPDQSTWDQRSIIGVDLGVLIADKPQAGLTISSDHGEDIYSARFPRQVFGLTSTSSASQSLPLPDTVRKIVLFVEDRALLEEHDPEWNYAFNFGRTMKAALQQAGIMGGHTEGGSTITEQLIGKGMGGTTEGIKDKLRQKLRANAWVYRYGHDTRQAQKEDELGYINQMPLAHENIGFLDGMQSWFGMSAKDTTALLNAPEDSLDAGGGQEKAQTIRRTVALALSVKAPTKFLATEAGRDRLNQRIDLYLPLLAESGIISPHMAEMASHVSLDFIPKNKLDDARNDAPRQKSILLLRTAAAGMLAVNNHDLERLDLTATASLDPVADLAVTNTLRSLKDPKVATEYGLIQKGNPYLLNERNVGKITYSVLVFETRDNKNLLRVAAHTDDTGQFDPNFDGRQQMGSTQKTKVLGAYLWDVSDLYDEWKRGSVEKSSSSFRNDPITRRFDSYIAKAANRNKSRKEVLHDALSWRVAGDPLCFSTGEVSGCVENFNNREGGMHTIQEALNQSINGAFIRLQIEHDRHVRVHKMRIDPTISTDMQHPERAKYLSEFADYEGKKFLAQAWEEQKELKTRQDHLDFLASQTRRKPNQLAVVYLALHPRASVEEMEGFIRKEAYVADKGGRIPRNKNGKPTSASTITAKTDFNWLHKTQGSGVLDLNDQGYVTGIHPLGIWLANWRSNQNELQKMIGGDRKDATLSQAAAVSKEERQFVYKWLLHPRNPERAQKAQRRAIETMIDRHVYIDHHLPQWQAMGYPYGDIVVDPRIAIGSAGSRPMAEVNALHAFQNHGKALPPAKFENLRFGADTPFGTHCEALPQQGRQVMPADVADTVYKGMVNVVESPSGTGHSLHGKIKIPLNGKLVTIKTALKTGTGNNKIVQGGQEVDHTGDRTVTVNIGIGQRIQINTKLTMLEPGAGDRFSSMVATRTSAALLQKDLQGLIIRSFQENPPTPDEILAIEDIPDPKKTVAPPPVPVKKPVLNQARTVKPPPPPKSKGSLLDI